LPKLTAGFANFTQVARPDFDKLVVSVKRGEPRDEQPAFVFLYLAAAQYEKLKYFMRHRKTANPKLEYFTGRTGAV